MLNLLMSVWSSLRLWFPSIPVKSSSWQILTFAGLTLQSAMLIQWSLLPGASPWRTDHWIKSRGTEAKMTPMRNSWALSFSEHLAMILLIQCFYFQNFYAYIVIIPCLNRFLYSLCLLYDKLTFPTCLLCRKRREISLNPKKIRQSKNKKLPASLNGSGQLDGGSENAMMEEIIERYG